jgi:hypothetical protein
MRRAGPPRAQALLLCLILLLGGLGLPMLDAVWFHSTPAAGAPPTEVAVQRQLRWAAQS